MKTFINGLKTPIIPLLLIDNSLISKFREKAKIFNNFFVEQCQPIADNIILPISQIFYTQNKLKDFDIDCGKILKLIIGLNPQKAHGHNGIPTPMVKLCNLKITEPLSII